MTKQEANLKTHQMRWKCVPATDRRTKEGETENHMIAQQVFREDLVGEDNFQWEKQAVTEERVRWKTFPSKGDGEAEGEEWVGAAKDKRRCPSYGLGEEKHFEQPLYNTVVSLPMSYFILDMLETVTTGGVNIPT